MDLEGIRSRCKELMTESGGSPMGFCKKHGLSPQLAYNYFNNKIKFPNFLLIDAFFKDYPRLNFNWLVTGSGNKTLGYNTYDEITSQLKDLRETLGRVEEKVNL